MSVLDLQEDNTMALWYDCGNGLVKTFMAASDLHLDAYLYCPGPSLNDVDGLDVHVAGTISFAMNTAYPKVRPDVWVGSDEPQCYDRRLLYEPFMKIYRGGYQTHKHNGTELRHYPRTFFADCDSVNDPLDMLDRRAHDVTFVWNRNTFMMTLHIMIWMGARDISLVGCNFGGISDYYDDRKLPDELRSYNRRLYANQVDFLRKLVPAALNRGIVIRSCTKDSPINQFMPFTPLKESFERSAKRVPENVAPVLHAVDVERCKWDSRIAAPQGVMVGCASVHEDLIPWWITNYKKYNSYPIAFADFGISPEMKEFCKAHGELIDATVSGSEGWFRKPFAILKAPFQKIIWCDTDIEIRGDLKPLWDYSNNGKIGAGHDSYDPPAFRTHLHPDAHLWDTGLISVEHGSFLIQEWAELIIAATQGYYRGEHSAFSEVIWNHKELLNPIAKTMHRMRLDPTADACDTSHLLTMHWTGDIGKNHIRDMTGKLPIIEAGTGLNAPISPDQPQIG